MYNKPFKVMCSDNDYAISSNPSYGPIFEFDEFAIASEKITRRKIV